MTIILLLLCGLIVLLTLGLIAKSLLALKQVSWLLPVPSSERSTTKISVIIPARNEEHDIAGALHSVLAQEGVDLEVIVVNDHSTDATGILVDEIAAKDSRVKVIHDPPLQSGWLGKCNAMQQGATRATADYLLFTDADIYHAPGCVASALAVMKKNDYDFFSFAPRCLNKSVWEHLNIPIYFVGFVKLLSLPGLDDPDSPNALASGAFMLIKKTVFNAHGGFECVKDAMFDDVGMAQSLKAHHYRVSYWFGPECSRVQLFKNAGDAFWGTTKNILGAVDGRAALALPLILVAIIQYWTPVVSIIFGGFTANPALVCCGLGTCILQYLSFFSIRRIIHFHPIKLLCFPLVVIVSTCCILRATAYQMKGKIYWRGRAIKVR